MFTMTNIELSEKHGVNPTLVLCFWCGEERGDIACLGKLPGDKEAPRRCVVDYTPCDSCQEKMNRGITIIENDKDNKPTGRWCVVKEEWVDNVNDEELRESIRKYKYVNASVDVYEMIIGTDE